MQTWIIVAGHLMKFEKEVQIQQHFQKYGRL